jgi:Ras-related protein Rab-7L1
MLDAYGSKGIAKVLVIGDVSTGKTSLIRRYTKGKFDESYAATIGVEFSLKEFKSSQTGAKLSIQLWDVAGQERFAGMNRIFYQHAVGAIIVYDVTNKSSFENALKWKKDVNDKVFLPSGQPIPVLLLGNKLDMVADAKEEQGFRQEEAESVISDQAFHSHQWVSAKTGEHVQETIDLLAESISAESEEQKKIKHAANQANKANKKEDRGNVDVNKIPTAQEESGGCC